MGLFSKPKVIIWPKSKTVDIYLDRKENNNFSVDINLWQECTDQELQSLNSYLRQNGIDSVSVLVPDDVILTKSFLYDTKITEIDKKEVIGLAESFIDFKIEPEAIEYNLVQAEDKTIIQSIIFDKPKIDILKTNLFKLNLKIQVLRPVSASISAAISTFYNQEYFLLYPTENNEFTLLLSKGDSVYLTSILKGASLNIQKLINYSNLYFKNIVNKLFLPQGITTEITHTAQLDKTEFVESQIAQNLKKAANFPLPVLGLLAISKPSSAAIIETPSLKDSNNNLPSMNNKKNILPIVAVFVFTAALASVIIWYILNRNKDVTLENPASTNQTVSNTTPTTAPTATPTPLAVTEISKSLKIQVLNATEINGQAALLKEKLTKLGFTSVAVGNSSEKLTENEVRVKESLIDTVEPYFKSKLGTYFPATFTDELKTTSSYDIVFVIGTDLSEADDSDLASVTPTKKATPTPEEE